MADILLRGLPDTKVAQLKWLASSRSLTPAELIARLLDLLTTLDHPDASPNARSALVEAGLTAKP